MKKKILFYLLLVVTLMSCVEEITYPNYQSGEAPLNVEGSVANDFVVRGIPRDIVRAYDIDLGYYSKYTSVWGIPIVASAEVDDIYLQNTAELVGLMLSDESLVVENASQIRNLLYQNMLRIAIFPDKEMGTKQLPEFKTFASADAYGATKEIPVIGFSVINVSECSEGLFHNDCGRIKQGSSLVHEIMHSIHNLAAEKVSPGFNKKLRKSYQNAQNKQIWNKDAYINENYEEYLAEGAEVWFNWQPYSYDNGLYFPKQNDLKNIDSNLYNVLNLIFQKNPEVMNNISFASPKVIFNFNNLISMFGYDYSGLKIDLYGDNEVIRSQTLVSSSYATTFIMPDPRVSYISFDNYKFKVTILYDNADKIIKEYSFSREELVAIDGFPSNINLHGTSFITN